MRRTAILCAAVALLMSPGCGSGTAEKYGTQAVHRQAKELQVEYGKILSQASSGTDALQEIRALQKTEGTSGNGNSAKWYIFASSTSSLEVSVDVAGYIFVEGSGPNGNPFGNGWTIMCTRLTGSASAFRTPKPTVTAKQIHCSPVPATEKNVPTTQIIATLEP